jgi:hypothetical protein
MKLQAIDGKNRDENRILINYKLLIKNRLLYIKQTMETN